MFQGDWNNFCTLLKALSKSFVDEYKHAANIGERVQLLIENF